MSYPLSNSRAYCLLLYLAYFYTLPCRSMCIYHAFVKKVDYYISQQTKLVFQHNGNEWVTKHLKPMSYNNKKPK